MSDVRESLVAVVEAWESLSGGKNYTIGDIQEWLSSKMTPAIRDARSALAQSSESGSLDNQEWIGVDLDGTLFTYDTWTAWNVFGRPIWPMIDRVKKWVADGKRVKILTARVAGTVDHCFVTKERVTTAMMTQAIQDLLEVVGLPRLEVTCRKDHLMKELWDDRCVQVVPNTGRTIAEEHASELSALRGKSWDPREPRE